jgi:hypothetical protein
MNNIHNGFLPSRVKNEAMVDWASVDPRSVDPRVLGNRKKIYRVDFFAKANFAGLTNYVIRHNPQNGNMMSLLRALYPQKSTLLEPVRALISEGNTVKNM